MARKTTGTSRDRKPADPALDPDAPVTEGQTQPPIVPEASAPDASVPKPDAAQTFAPTRIDDAEVVSETPAPSPQAQSDVAQPDATQSDMAAHMTEQAAPVDPEPFATMPDEPAPEPARARAPAAKPSIVPMLLGGAFAAALGFGAHMLTQTTAATDLRALDADLTALRTEVQALDVPPPFDPAPLSAEIAALNAAVADLANAAPAIDPSVVAALGTQVQAVAAGTAALTADMGALRADMDALQTEMADLRLLSQTRVAEAEAAVDDALARAGLDMVRAALDAGTPFDGAVAQIAAAGIDVPAPLSDIAVTGIVTPDALIESFDASARAALRASLTDAPAASTTERLGNFLRAQVGARSTAPREGDDPDAILSRADAAVQTGDFAAALAELDTLPDAGRAAMADWIQAARARDAALAALPDLSQAIAP